jgi:hypothetical protein
VIHSNDWKTEGPFGPKFYRFHHKPEDAIEHLLSVKQGEAIGAIHKDGIGDIDFVWDDPDRKGKAGLRHIIERRTKEGLNGVEFVRSIPEIIRKGIVLPDPEGKGLSMVIVNDDGSRLALVSLEAREKAKT